MLSAISTENSKTLKYHILSKKKSLSITCDKWDSDDNNIHKEKEHI